MDWSPLLDFNYLTFWGLSSATVLLLLGGSRLRNVYGERKRGKATVQRVGVWLCWPGARGRASRFGEERLVTRGTELCFLVVE